VDPGSSWATGASDCCIAAAHGHFGSPPFSLWLAPRWLACAGLASFKLARGTLESSLHVHVVLDRTLNGTLQNTVLRSRNS